jgi:nucleotide-binding universal stress UspA family protein
VKHLNLREAEEMRLDREYLEATSKSLVVGGLRVESLLAGGDPAMEISTAAGREGCDLIAMSTHGHRFIKDMLYGSLANEVRHMSLVPVLLVRGPASVRENAKAAA